MNVLILDDDVPYAELVAIALRGIAESVSWENSWASALDSIERKMPNVLWADLNIPPEGPGGSIERVRELHRKYPDLVIVVASGYLLDGVKDRLEEAGAVLAMEKAGRFEPTDVASLVLFGVYLAAQRAGEGPNSDFLKRTTDLLAPHINIEWHQPPPSGLAPPHHI